MKKKKVLKLGNSLKKLGFFFFSFHFFWQGYAWANLQIPWHLTFGGYSFLSAVPLRCCGYSLSLDFTNNHRRIGIYNTSEGIWPHFTDVRGLSRWSHSRNTNNLKLGSGFGLPHYFSALPPLLIVLPDSSQKVPIHYYTEECSFLRPFVFPNISVYLVNDTASLPSFILSLSPL